MRKIVKLTFLSIILFGLGFSLSYAWKSFPLITAYGSKIMCSCVFVAERTEESVLEQELGSFPISLGRFNIDKENGTVTGTVFGTAKRVAIYREGLGCTSLAEKNEDKIRSQETYLVAKPAWSQDTVAWPLGNLINDSILSLSSSNKIQALINQEFEDEEKIAHLTHIIVVLHKGELLAEGYGNGHTISTKHTGWSMTKSIISNLVGIQVDKGVLTLEQNQLLPHWDDDRSTIQLRHMLQATNGLDWVENYGGVSDATNMLFLKPNAVEIASNKPLKYEPGTYFYYSSGTTNILSGILRNTLGEVEYQKSPYRDLFFEIGMHNTIIEKDASGTYVGSSFCFAPGRDWARFGLLMLNRGNWLGKQIISEDWVTFATTPNGVAPRGEYGAQWWLNAGNPQDPNDKIFPDLPNDTFYAGGFEGQWVLVIPSKELVIVRLGYSPKGGFNMNDFASEVIHIVEK